MLQLHLYNVVIQSKITPTTIEMYLCSAEKKRKNSFQRLYQWKVGFKRNKISSWGFADTDLLCLVWPASFIATFCPFVTACILAHVLPLWKLQLCHTSRSMLEELTLPHKGIHSLWQDGGRGFGNRDPCFRRRWPWRHSLCRSSGEVRSSTTAWWRTSGSSAPLRGEPQPWRSYSQWPQSHPSSAAPGGDMNSGTLIIHFYLPPSSISYFQMVVDTVHMQMDTFTGYCFYISYNWSEAVG